MLLGPSPQCRIPRLKIIGLLVSENNIFKGVLPWIGMAAILVIWPGPFERIFIPPSHWCAIWYRALTGPAVSEKKMFEECERRTDDGQTTEPAYTIYKLTHEPKGSGELKSRWVRWFGNFHCTKIKIQVKLKLMVKPYHIACSLQLKL